MRVACFCGASFEIADAGTYPLCGQPFTLPTKALVAEMEAELRKILDSYGVIEDCDEKIP